MTESEFDPGNFVACLEYLHGLKKSTGRMELDVSNHIDQLIRKIRSVAGNEPDTTAADRYFDIGKELTLLTIGSKIKNTEYGLYYFLCSKDLHEGSQTPCPHEILFFLARSYATRPYGTQWENQEKAIARYEEVLKIYYSKNEIQKWAEAHYDLGIIYLDRIKDNGAKNQNKALKSLKKALYIFNHEQMSLELSKTMNAIGVAFNERIKGDKTRNQLNAIKYFRMALKTFVKCRAPLKRAGTIYNIANVFLNLENGNSIENLEKAKRCLENSLEKFSPGRNPLDWATTVQRLTQAYLQGVGDLKKKDIEKTVKRLQETLAQYPRKHDPLTWARIMARIGKIYYHSFCDEKPEYAENAIKCFEDALEVCEEEQEPFNCAEIMHDLGHIYLKRRAGNDRNNFSKAVEYFKKASDVIEEMRSIMPNDDIRLNFFSDYIESYNSLIDLFLDRKALVEALHWIERSRSRSLIDKIDLEMIKSESGEDTKLVNRYWQINKQIGHCYEKLPFSYSELYMDLDRPINMEFSENGLRRPAAIARNWRYDRKEYDFNREMIKNLRDERRQILKELDETDPGYVMKITGIPPSSEEFAEFLENQDAAILHFHIRGIIEKRGVALVSISKNKKLDIKNFSFNAHDCIKALNRWLETYRKKIDDRKSMKNTLDELLRAAGKCIQPIYEYLEVCGIKRLFICPHQYLHLIPWHAALLPGFNCHLIEKLTSVNYTPSLTFVNMVYSCWREKRQNQMLKIFCLFYSPKEKPLPFGKEQVDALESIYSKEQIFKSLINDKATLDELKSKLPQKSPVELIFCCHGDPEGLLLSDFNPITRNELLANLHEYHLQSVILSACETGKNQLVLYNADEYGGLDSVFMQMNTPNIVSSIYKIYDEGTKELMIDYHKLRKKRSSSEALAEAQRNMIKSLTTVSMKKITMPTKKNTRRGISEDTCTTAIRINGHPLDWAFIKHSGLFNLNRITSMS